MQGPIKDFYKGKKVLVTGHTGFKGGWLSLLLLKLGANIAGYAFEPPSKPNIYEIFDLNKRMLSVIGDVRDRAKVKSFFKDFEPEIVIHMAAQAFVRQSYQDPANTFETNVMGTVNVLEACREVASIRSVVVVTSDKCYENNGENKPYQESDPMGGHDPYSSSKGCTELVTAAYARSFFSSGKCGGESKIALASARAGNVIGGGDWAKDRIIPDCIKAILDNKSVIIRYPEAIRPWQHVLEPLYGYLLLAQKLYENGPNFSGPWNFGPGGKNEQTVQWVVEKVNELWGSELSWTLEPQKQPHEAICLRLDSTKSESLLKWQPLLELTSALKETVDWYKAWQKNDHMYEFSIKQIENYMSKF